MRKPIPGELVHIDIKKLGRIPDGEDGEPSAKPKGDATISSIDAVSAPARDGPTSATAISTPPTTTIPVSPVGKSSTTEKPSPLWGAHSEQLTGSPTTASRCKRS